MDKPKSLKWYIGIFIGVIILFIICVWININLLNTQFDTNSKSLSKSKQSSNPLLTLRKDSTSIYNLKDEDLQKFNDHINYLTDKVETEVKRTQENNQYDIDRINTFLSIGLALLAIIGGLLPIFVNYFSKEHLEKRIKGLEDESKNITIEANVAKETANTAKTKAESAEKEANAANKSLTEIGSQIEKFEVEIKPMKAEVDKIKEATIKIPVIDLLVFQNAVAKLTSSDTLKLLIGTNRYKDLIAYLQNLNSSIDSIESKFFQHYQDSNITYFKNVITELKLALRLGPIRRIPDSRSFQKKIDEVVLCLDKFDTLETKDFKAQLILVSNKITELEKLVKLKINNES